MNKVNTKFDFSEKRRILIGASTGGVDAIIKIISFFPYNCPPTLIVQHTKANFVPGLASLLNTKTQANVKVAQTYEELSPGVIYLAPGGKRHLVLDPKKSGISRLKHSPPNEGHRPSVNELFLSAEIWAKNISAAILTGMGSDGAVGLARLRQAGAQTFGQNEESCVVYGMPRVAKRLAAVDKELPISQVGSALLTTCLKVQREIKG